MPIRHLGAGRRSLIRVVLRAIGCGWRGLLDVEPAGDVHLLQLELEEGIVRHRLNHPADAAAGDDIAHQRCGRRIIGHVDSDGTDPQLVIVGPRQSMDHTAAIAANSSPRSSDGST
jgi:hypothetical protein